MNYRVKTHEELLAAGFVISPAGTYMHPRFDKITLEMLNYATQFSSSLIKTLFETPYGQRQFIDVYTYCAQHFVEEPHLQLVV